MGVLLVMKTLHFIRITSRKEVIQDKGTATLLQCLYQFPLSSG